VDGGGHRSVFEHLFVNEMRDAPLMTAYVLEYDEADPGAEKHTWVWLLKKGRASFQRERERGNLGRQQTALRDIPRSVGWDPAAPAAPGWDVAAPAWENTPNGGGRGSSGGGRGSGKVDQPSAPRPMIPKQPPAQPDVPKPKARNDAKYADEQRAAAGECWFFNRGSCAKKNRQGRVQ
jgi:hypothetical protein